MTDAIQVDMTAQEARELLAEIVALPIGPTMCPRLSELFEVVSRLVKKVDDGPRRFRIRYRFEGRVVWKWFIANRGAHMRFETRELAQAYSDNRSGLPGEQREIVEDLPKRKPVRR